MRCATAGFLFAALSVMTTYADEPKSTEATRAHTSAKHQGVWKPIAAVLGGVRLPESACQAITLTLDGDQYEVTVEGEAEPDRGTFTLDPAATPKRMTITSKEGPNKGKTFLAIYEMKDDVSMRVCYDLSGTEFPREFKAPPKSSLYLVGYRRQKPAAKAP